MRVFWKAIDAFVYASLSPSFSGNNPNKGSFFGIQASTPSPLVLDVRSRLMTYSARTDFPLPRPPPLRPQGMLVEAFKVLPVPNFISAPLFSSAAVLLPPKARDEYAA